MVIAGCDRGFRVGSRCQSDHAEKTGLVLGLANRSTEQLRIRWDSETDSESQGPLPEANLKNLKMIEEETFNLEKFGKIDVDIISELSRIVDYDPNKNPVLDSASIMSNSRTPLVGWPRIFPGCEKLVIFLKI